MTATRFVARPALSLLSWVVRRAEGVRMGDHLRPLAPYPGDRRSELPPQRGVRGRLLGAGGAALGLALLVAAMWPLRGAAVLLLFPPCAGAAGVLLLGVSLAAVWRNPDGRRGR